MDVLYQQALRVMEMAFCTLEQQVEKPKLKPFEESFVFRYVEQNAYQAVIQKLARMVSGLYAARHLLKGGYLQEQGAIHRTLDEFEEDILFLCHGLIHSNLTELHQKYLSWFYEEEFDVPGDPISSTQKRGMVSRKKIRAYIARIGENELNTSKGIEISRTLNKGYSGFVHGASPQIMEVYCGNPPKFHISGMLETPRMKEHYEDLWNYMFRGILSFISTAKAFKNKDLVLNLEKYLAEFNDQSGTNYGGNADL